MSRSTAYLPLCGVVTALAVSCGSPAQPSLAQATAATPTDSAVGAIAAARNPQCAAIGLEVARYLETGDNAGDPELDTGYAQDLRYILDSPRQAQPGLIRLDADDATAKCDAKVDAATAQAVAAAAAAAQQQRMADEQATRAAQLQAAQRKSCAAIGGQRGTGTSGGARCNSTQTSNSHCMLHDFVAYPVYVSFTEDGSIATADYSDTKRNYPGCFN